MIRHVRVNGWCHECDGIGRMNIEHVEQEELKAALDAELAEVKPAPVLHTYIIAYGMDRRRIRAHSYRVDHPLSTVEFLKNGQVFAIFWDVKYLEVEESA